MPTQDSLPDLISFRLELGNGVLGIVVPMESQPFLAAKIAGTTNCEAAAKNIKCLPNQRFPYSLQVDVRASGSSMNG